MNTTCICYTDAVTGDICHRILHKSGLEIRIMEMPDFSTAYAQFGTKFGSYQTVFQKTPEDSVENVPIGTAHFLEHKLFEQKYGDVSNLFSRLGVSDNAYTNYDHTVYHFQTQSNFKEALEILLQFVQQPCFTEESVEQEKSIIKQEILEGMDDPATVNFHQMMQGLYHSHPIRWPILGTLESIRDITADTLYQCHDAYYNLHNMVLCCTGNVYKDEILEIADRILSPAPPFRMQNILPDEPDNIASAYRQSFADIGKTQFSIGFKSKPAEGSQQMRESLLSLITADLLIGAVSPLQKKLLSEGMINDTFSTDCFIGDSWCTIYMDGESDHPKQVLEEILAEIRRMQNEGIDEVYFHALKCAAFGDVVISMNDPGTACDVLMESYMAGKSSPFARSEILASIQKEDILHCLQERFQPEQCCLSVIIPETERKEFFK
ncbi:MAG: insulinase family protein [Oscillospiraceae bacterium]|nr:insulinase family protein [Oscillospiraceae bacterium]